MADICENTDSEHYDNRLQQIKIMVGKYERLFSLSFLCKYEIIIVNCKVASHAGCPTNR